MKYIGIICMSVCVVHLVLHASGNSCPRYPPSSCQGPFTFRPSSAKKLPNDPNCPGDQALLESCLKQCMEDLCCRAFGVEDGNCNMVNFHTEAYHFVKEAPAWPVSSDVCLNNTGCVVGIGGAGGDRLFSLNQTFIDAASDLRAISGEFDDDRFLTKIAVDYGNGFVGSKVLGPGVESFRCELDAGEYITGVTGYMYLLFGVIPVFKGIQFTTTLKTCGPYGLVTQIERSFNGHMLLYVAGNTGSHFDKLEFTFLKC